MPPVWANKTPPGVADRPDGHDPRDQYVGRKRIDTPVAGTGAGGGVRVARVRFNCLRAMEEPVFLKAVELRERQVPWEPGWRGGAAARK